MKFLKILGVVIVVVGIAFFAAGQVSSSVHVERTMNAPVSRVWPMFADAEKIKQWWGPTDYTAPVVEHEFRVGGDFVLSMQSPGGEKFWNVGKYVEIVPEQKIVSTLAFANEKRQVLTGSQIPVPGKWPDHVMVTIHFRSDGEKTVVTVDETGIPLIMKLFAGMGWEQQFDKLDALLAQP